MPIEIELTRLVDGPGVLEALEAHGLGCRIVEGEEGRLAVQVRDEGSDSTGLSGEVAHALGGWLAESGLPLVPAALGDGSYVLRPPAA